ncbi:SUMF1/EgtB/PvdO family nonheme iron enzyme [Tichowtungia aerotolerans]|nr:SUMF1/EgtB/PvdO family nonheme iron enzyme [Tichowtungia aerotolerans]
MIQTIMMTLAGLCGVAAATVIEHDGTSVSIDFVEIGAAGNSADPTNGIGAVSYAYQIGQYELTEAQWDTVQAISGGELGAGTSNGADAPVASITWNEIAMYCNWLTTGDFESGAYTIHNGEVVAVMDRAKAALAFGTVYVIPTEDEWYKAAYYSVSNGVFSGYANGLNVQASGDKVTGENHLKESEGGLGLWNVGEGLLEQNGTYDMGGNLAEFTESGGWGARIVRDSYFGWSTKPGAVENTDLNDKAESYASTSYGVRLAAVTIAPLEFVEIGDPGNSADGNGIGAVDYTYEIGKYELTEGQWDMVRAFSDGLLGVGTANGVTAPVGDMSWNEIAMYCNWLTTGNFDSGAYAISNGVVIDVKTRAEAIAKYGTVYVIPTEDEWYKAAYYSTNTASFSDYVNGTDVMPDGLQGTGENHLKETEGGLGLWNVGLSMLEQNGTYDMGGNLAEWTESGVWGSRIVRDSWYGWTTKSGANENTGLNTKLESYDSTSYGVRLARVTGELSSESRTITHNGSSVSMEFVRIGSSGNSADTNGVGAVSYSYKIGKYELTEGQWNAIRQISGGVLGEGSDNGPFNPVSYISWNEIAMYCNWLTTGDFESGAYTISDGVVTAVMDHEAAQSLYGTVYVIPTEDEWYKAAYYSTGSGTYSGYANGTDVMPSGAKIVGENHIKEGATEDGVVGLGLWTIGEGVQEQNGTYDMGGNMAEFTETAGGLGRVVRDAPYSWTAKSGAVENTGTNTKAEDYQSSVYSVRLAVLEPEETTAQGVPVAWMNDNGVSDEYDTAEQTDADGDGLLMWEEYYCGTDPNNAGSAFKVALSGSELSWTASSANSTAPFNVFRSIDLTSGWEQVATNVTRSATGTTSWTDPNPPTESQVFYKTTFDIP